MSKDKEEKIYKYASLENAIKILENNSVKLEFPDNYNDPFDSVIDIRQIDIRKSLEIITEYYVAQEFLKLFENKEIKVKKHIRLLMNWDRFLLKLYLDANKRNKYYDSIPVIRWISKLMMNTLKVNNHDEFKKMFETQSKQLFETIKEFRNKALISCFSKRNDSILMWSHYADNHRGVCIEYDRPNKDFFNVGYSKNRCLFDLEYITRKYLGHLLANERIDIKNEILINNMMRPFLTKSRDWKYEEEVRCIFTVDTNGVYLGKKHYLYKMTSTPTKIYVGCKVDKKSNNYETLVNSAKDKGVEIVEMEASRTKFAVIPSS